MLIFYGLEPILQADLQAVARSFKFSGQPLKQRQQSDNTSPAVIGRGLSGKSGAEKVLTKCKKHFLQGLTDLTVRLVILRFCYFSSSENSN